mmetsp:Transcript_1903/g.5692  ORF Transcript_1903/g.5692 Transcript_1903/m.5692 type:complete len:251 (-) Transcript_1903:150-902(-)
MLGGPLSWRITVSPPESAAVAVISAGVVAGGRRSPPLAMRCSCLICSSSSSAATMPPAFRRPRNAAVCRASTCISMRARRARTPSQLRRVMGHEEERPGMPPSASLPSASWPPLSPFSPARRAASCARIQCPTARMLPGRVAPFTGVPLPSSCAGPTPTPTAYCVNAPPPGVGVVVELRGLFASRRDPMVAPPSSTSPSSAPSAPASSLPGNIWPRLLASKSGLDEPNQRNPDPADSRCIPKLVTASGVP